MINRNYTTEQQVIVLVRRLLILSSAIKLKELSKGQLLSTLRTIHDNHILLADLLNEGKGIKALDVEKVNVEEGV